MDGNQPPSEVCAASRDIVVCATAPCDRQDTYTELLAGLGDGPFSLIALFASSDTVLEPLAEMLCASFKDTTVIGCSTAGEIAPHTGYVEGQIVAVGFASEHFQSETLVIPDLAARNDQDLVSDIIRMRARLTRAAPHLETEFAFLLIDGLSCLEDQVASTVASGLGPVPFFGGSAGDGTRFERSFVLHDGAARSNAAVLTLLRTDCDVDVFSLNHFHPTESRMVVTRADPKRRIVYEINAEPAAQELARLLGKPPGQIDTFTFAENPMVVRFGGTHHVRAIKRVTDDGALEFFSAIDEGLVLTMADAEPIVSHLDNVFQELSKERLPTRILACDCILRRIEVEQKQQTQPIGEVLSAYNVAGFSTYGEQHGGMHVNQTMTGVAIYPPDGQ